MLELNGEKLAIRHIPLNYIDPPSFLLREIDGATINDLRISIKRHGVLQPILLNYKPETKRYVIVFGNHRFYAAKGAKLRTIPALITEISEHDAMLLSLTENIQRIQMNPVKEGEAFTKLDLGAKHLSRVLGKSIQYIQGRIDLYKNLHPNLRREIGRDITLTNALHLCKLTSERQLMVFEQIKRSKKEIKLSQPNHYGLGSGGIGVRDGSSFCICPNCSAKHLRGFSSGMIIPLGKPVKLPWLGNRIFHKLMNAGIKYDRASKHLTFETQEQLEILRDNGYNVNVE